MQQKELRLRKVILLLFFHLLVLSPIFSQNKEVCDSFVHLLAKTINNKSATKLKPWFSENFTILGQKGDIAVQVMNMLVMQLNDSVLSYTETKFENKNGILTIEYDFEYQNKDKKKTKISFNKENKVTYIKLIEAKVKTLGKSDKPKIINSTGKQVITIPIQIINHLIFVEVWVNGEKHKFILDSGSARTKLNSKYYHTTSSISSLNGINGQSVSGMDIITLESLNFYGLCLKNEKMVTANLNYLEKTLKQKVYGLIGTDMIEQFDVLFDYKKKTITLIKPVLFESYATENLNMRNYYTIPFVRQKGHLPIITLNIASEKYELAIDCGASSNAMSISHYSDLEKSIKKVKTSKLRGLSKEVKEVKSCKLKEVSIGNKHFRSVKTVFTNLMHLNKNEEFKIDGIIGYEILSKQKTIISYERQELLLEK